MNVYVFDNKITVVKWDSDEIWQSPIKINFKLKSNTFIEFNLYLTDSCIYSSKQEGDKSTENMFYRTSTLYHNKQLEKQMFKYNIFHDGSNQRN